MNADPVQEKPMMKDKLRTMLSGYDAVIDAPAILFSGELAEIILYDKRCAKVVGEFPGCGENDVALVVGYVVLSYADVEVFWGVDWGLKRR